MSHSAMCVGSAGSTPGTPVMVLIQKMDAPQNVMKDATYPRWFHLRIRLTCESASEGDPQKQGRAHTLLWAHWLD